MAGIELNMLGRLGMMVQQSDPSAKLGVYKTRTANAGVEAATVDPVQTPRDLSFQRPALDTQLNLGQGEIINILA